MAFKTHLGEETLTVFIGLKPRTIHNSHENWDEIVRLAHNGDPSTDTVALERLLDPMAVVRDAAVEFDGSLVTVTPTGATYDGEYLPFYLQKRLIDMVDAGFDIEPWKKFVERVYQNPIQSAREELALFMDTAQFPLTDDGCFVAYKTVRDTYMDWYSNSMDNSPGRVVEMARSEVDPDRDRTCSTGLHFCAKSYLGSFHRNSGRVVAVKVAPEDVVAIPSDYSNTKGRAWRYEVLHEIPLDDLEKHEWGIYVSTAPDADEEYDGCDEGWNCPSCGSEYCEQGWCEDEDEYDDEYETEGELLASPLPEVGAFDPEFQRLLDEEKEIEREARENVEAIRDAPEETYQGDRAPIDFEFPDTSLDGSRAGLLDRLFGRRK